MRLNIKKTKHVCFVLNVNFVKSKAAKIVQDVQSALKSVNLQYQVKFLLKTRPLPFSFLKAMTLF